MILESRDQSRARTASLAGLACVLIVCCLPLFNRLGGLEQRNDEAIYSYSVDRMLETGDWLTPRNIPDDAPFLEKPPLKFWMVALPMKLGLLPQDDWGMRFPDAVLCTLAFVYIYLLGVRLSGPVAGFVSVFLLFSFEPLLFQHGIRGNNMEGSLLLAYCGGIYHFFRWAEQDGLERRRQAWFFCSYFFLGFMTKFVGAIFLPVVCVAALAARRAGWNDWRQKWRDWLKPVAVTAGLIAPWFIYQTIRDAHWFWHVILMDHVITRFTGVLMKSHLHPWHHYFTSLWDELQRAGSLPVVVLGLIALAVKAAPAARARIASPRAPERGEWGWGPTSTINDGQLFLARLLLLWWLLPEIVISFGTSKLFYYSFPFLPPLFIGAGLASAQILNLFTRGVFALLAKLPLAGFRANRVADWQTRRLSYSLTVLGALSFIIAASTAYWGSVTWQMDGVRLFKNSSIIKPLLVGAGTWYFAGLGGGAVQVIGAGLLSLLVPISAYEAQCHRLNQIDAPLRAARDCALSVQASKNLAHNGVFKMSGDTDHPYYYYLWRLGPYLFPERAGGDELVRRLDVEGQQSLVVLSVEDYVYLGGMTRLPAPVINADSGLAPAVSEAAKAAHLAHGMPPAVAISENVVMLFPAEYASCARVVAHAGLRSKKLDATGPR